MDKILTSIYGSLQRLLGLHRQLLDCVRLEKKALVDADLKGIHEATIAKQGLIEGIRQTENDRVKAVTELAILLRKPVRELTLANLIIEIQGKDLKLAERFRSVFNALTILIKHVSEQNQENQGLVARSLEHVGEMKKNVLGETVPRSSTYNPQGQKTSGASGARLISKEA